MTLKQIRSLAIGGDIDASVIDCWAALLNKSEEHKKASAPSRMFFPTDMIVSGHVLFFLFFYFFVFFF